MSETMNDPEAGTELHPFNVLDLPNVLDRVETPIQLQFGSDVLDIVKGWFRWSGSSVDVLLTDDQTMSLDGSVMVELLGPVEVLDADREVLCYHTRDGEVLCADHGARWDIGVTDGDVYPILKDNGDGIEAVGYCSHVWAANDRGHSFCGSCGTPVEPKGHPDSGFVGEMFECWNCRAHAVYVDGAGWQHVDGFDYVTEGHNVTIKGSAVHRELSDTPLTITAMVDATPYRFTSTRGYVCYLDVAPYEGRVLVLDSSWDGANDEAESHFDEVRERWVAEVIEAESIDTSTAEGLEAVEAVEADFRAALQVVRVDLDAVEFTSKR